MKIKLLALDMDGTAYRLAGDIIPSNLAPIKTLMNQGVEVVFLTGRPVHAPQNRFAHHKLISPSTIVAGHNGAVIYHLKDQKVLHKSVISPAQAHSAFQLVDQLGTRNTIIFGYVDDFKTVVLNLENPQVRNPQNLHDNEMDFIEGRYETYIPGSDYSYFKFLIFAGNKKLFDALKRKGFSVATHDNYNAEINAPGVHKGSAIKWLSDYYKIKPQHIMAIGDGSNDLPMMEQVEHSVSLANSIPALKKMAKHQIPFTNEEGGVAYAINHLILEKGLKK